MELKILIILHTLGATVWIGGHLILTATFLPRAWKSGDHKIITVFEESFERIGIPSLLVQVITGLRMATIYVPFSDWFDFSDALSRLVSFKIILLVCTIALAVHARFFIIPKLDDTKIPLLGSHIIAVTVISLLFLVTGLSFRLGIL